jgi:hypothetical protein
MSGNFTPAEVSSRWAPDVGQLPSHLNELAGPVTGVVELPLHLVWSGLRAFDLSDDKLLLGMYRVVLANGRREDFRNYLNGDALAAWWPVLRKMVGGGVRAAWEGALPELRAAVE